MPATHSILAFAFARRQIFDGVNKDPETDVRESSIKITILRRAQKC